MADLKVEITVNDTMQKVMLNDLLSIEDWVTAAVVGKQNNCWKRFRESWTTKLMDDDSFTDPIPSNQAAFVTLVTGRDDYKTRKQRDEAESL
tara:strand:+ start:195 stop:470 length:276 start_codon:yes stop_codon:yes gene_type:complete